MTREIELKGTEKQVQYANDIKNSILERQQILENYLDVKIKKGLRSAKMQSVMLEKTFDFLNTTDDSVMIIENFKDVFDEVQNLKRAREISEEFLHKENEILIINKITKGALNIFGEDTITDLFNMKYKK